MRRGFTLVELLTVLAILVILAGITWTLARPARFKALESASRNQLRQIGAALIQYATDTDSTSTYPELHGMAYTNSQVFSFMDAYGLPRDMLESPVVPHDIRSFLGSTYLVAFATQPATPDGGISLGRAQMIDRERAMGVMLEMAIDTGPDEYFYYPSEASIDLSLASPYKLWLATDGSVQSARCEPPRILSIHDKVARHRKQ